MDEILSQHGHPTAKIRADIDRNMTLSASEAVAYGVADQVITDRRARTFRLAHANCPQPGSIARPVAGQEKPMRHLI
jgi:hypothetical protein